MPPHPHHNVGTGKIYSVREGVQVGLATNIVSGVRGYRVDPRCNCSMGRIEHSTGKINSINSLTHGSTIVTTPRIFQTYILELCATSSHLQLPGAFWGPLGPPQVAPDGPRSFQVTLQAPEACPVGFWSKINLKYLISGL